LLPNLANPEHLHPIYLSFIFVQDTRDTQIILREESSMQRISELHVNGTNLRINADADRSLLSVLRDDLDLTGSKYGCGEGQCGACTVLIDGQATRSCVTTVGAAAGKKIATIESLEKKGRLHPLQEAFLEADALQCGYCTPGMIMSGIALLSKNPSPSDQEIVRFMEGNICRCGTYPRIVTAIRKAAQSMKGGGR
jgi:aerobic-type carbon monoxide dehydrogenase small subunit (CoxS/CutS family)